MRAAWIVIGVAMFVTCVAAWVMDERGDEESAEMWGCAMFALGLAAIILYGWEYRLMESRPSIPTEQQVIDGRPLSDFDNRPWRNGHEVPIVYDQPLETKD